MTTPESTKKDPIASFSPQLFSALIKGSKQQYEVILPYRQAVRFRIRAHQLRHRMWKERHELYPVVAKTKLSISWDEKKVPTKVGYNNSKKPIDIDAPVTLTIGPRDSEYTAALEAAGITIEAPEPTDSSIGSIGSPSDLENILKDWDK